jgi:hypothetical protein
MRIHLSLILACIWGIGFPAWMLVGALPIAPRAAPTETATATVIPTAAILSPSAGQAVQGSVPVIVFSDIQGFQSAELSFGYTNDQTGTWFLIAQNDQPITNGEIGTWDTNLITDGNYNLRMEVVLQDGNRVDTAVTGVRVRNYSLVETSTPTPVTPTATLVPGEQPTVTATSIPTITATATSLPTNQAEMTGGQITSSLGKGALGAVILFGIVGLYILIKQGKGKERIDGSE